MIDLISRQDATKNVRNLQTYKLFEGDDMLLVDVAEVLTELMMLPSAQPEVRTQMSSADCISRQDAIDALSIYGDKLTLDNVAERIYGLPSAQPDLLEDGTLMMTVPQGMLEKIKRVLVDEFDTKNCKVMYQDAERKKGKWIDQDDGAYYPVECSECRKIPLFDVDGDYMLSNYCPNCGADMRKET